MARGPAEAAPPLHPKARQPRLRRRARAAVVAFAASTALVAWAGTAAAHAQLESADPGPSSVLAVPPRQVLLHFGEPVTADAGSLRVLDPSGRRVDAGGARHPGTDSTSVVVPLDPGLGRGTYIVAWRVISADSHPVHGAYTFSVGTAAGERAAAAEATRIATQSGSTAVGVLFGVVRFAAFAALLVLVGLAVVVRLAWPAGGRSRRVRRILVWSWAVLAATTVAAVLLQGPYGSALPLGDALRPSLVAEVLRTRFGEVQVLRLVLLLVAAPVLLAVAGRWRQPAGPTADGIDGTPGAPDGTPAPEAPVGGAGLAAAVCLLGVALLATAGLAGHAATGSSPAVGLALDVVHLAAASVWLGGLVLLATFLVGRPDGPAVPADPLDVTLHVSSLAFVAVVTVVGTGVAQAFRQVGSAYALFHTTYGRALLVKVGLVVVLIALGGLSRRVLHRATGGTDGVGSSGGTDGTGSSDGSEGSGSRPASVGLGRLRRTVVAELLVVAAVLSATAVLVDAVPARQAVSLPFSTSWTTLGVQVNAVVSPARVGPGNVLHLYVLGPTGTPRAVPELDASLSLPSASIGPIAVPLRLVGPGHYADERLDLPAAGTWVLEVTVRTTAIDEDVVRASFGVH